MWIEISDDIESAYPQPTLQLCSVFESLALAMFHGKHVVFASRNLIRWLALQNLGGASRAALTRLHSKFAELASLRGQIPFKMIVVPGAGVVERSGSNWLAPIENLIGTQFSATELIAENTRDGQIFAMAAQHYRRREKINSLYISLGLTNGGGSEISRCAAERIANRASPIIVVTDSDHDHPGCSAGENSRKCEHVITGSHWTVHHEILPCREVENFIPQNIFNDAVRWAMPDAGEQRKLDAINDIDDRCDMAYKYADIKNGVSGYFASDQDPLIARREFWRSVVSQLGTNGCVNCEGCQCKTHGDCECQIFEGLGTYVADHVIAYCNNIAESRQLQRAQTSKNFDDWMDVGRSVFYWGVAEAQLRV